MDIIRNASVLDQKYLLIFENHSLDKEYTSNLLGSSIKQAYLCDYIIPCKT